MKNIIQLIISHLTIKLILQIGINIVFFQIHPIVCVKRFINFRFELKEVLVLLTMSSLNK